MVVIEILQLHTHWLVIVTNNMMRCLIGRAFGISYSSWAIFKWPIRADNFTTRIKLNHMIVFKNSTLNHIYSECIRFSGIFCQPFLQVLILYTRTYYMIAVFLYRPQKAILPMKDAYGIIHGFLYTFLIIR